MLTAETLIFIRDLLGQMTIPVKDPDFRGLATRMIKALDEIDAELAAYNERNQ